MALYSAPPPLHTLDYDKPTLLVCWWITLFCATIIFLRVAGRFIRSEELFAEDKTAALATIPLFLRMGCVHVVLLYGTNNAELPPSLSEEEVRRRAIGSGLVLASRVFYTATLWTLKSAILEFFKRLTSTSWKRSNEVTLFLIRCTLGATFTAVLISNLVECRPFHHYYQVLPDPGGQCRQGFVQMLTMASCNVMTDLLLVIFPVSIILRSHMTLKRKVQLVLLFSLSLGVVGVTLYRVSHVFRQNGSQQIRSLLASIELLFATTAANALVLGSFVRDRGVKKTRFRYGSVAHSSVDGSARSARRPTYRYWGSDEDLVRDVGLGVDRGLRDASSPGASPDSSNYTAAPMARMPEDMRHWQFPRRQEGPTERNDDFLLPGDQLGRARTNSTMTPRRVSFFDVGGLLGDEQERSKRDSYNSSADPLSPRSLPSTTVPATPNGFRRGSQALLLDLGGLLGPFGTRFGSGSKPSSPDETELDAMPQHRREHRYDPADTRHQPVLVDAGGLLP